MSKKLMLILVFVFILVGAACAGVDVSKAAGAGRNVPGVTFESEFEIIDIEGAPLQYMIHKRTGTVYLRAQGDSCIVKMEWPDGRNYTRDDLLSQLKKEGLR